MNQNFIKALGFEGYIDQVIFDDCRVKFCFDLKDLEDQVNALFIESGIVDHFLVNYSNFSSDKLLANELDRYLEFMKKRITDGCYTNKTSLDKVVEDLTDYVTLRTIELHRYTNGGSMRPIPLESTELNDIIMQDFVTLLVYYFNMTGISDYISMNSYKDEEAFDKSQEIIDSFRDFLIEIDEACNDLSVIDMYAEMWFKEYYKYYCR